MKQTYTFYRPSDETKALIHLIDKIMAGYQAQGYTLSVRQLYYQLVARDLIPNTERSYKRIASIINDARMGGFLDWEAIEDRGRDIEVRSRWTSGRSILEACVDSFHMDMWEGQAVRPFVIVEKAALAGVLGNVCTELDVPLLAARGYPSVSIVRELALKHLAKAIDEDQVVMVFHMGDHDPSGIDMTRDLEERLTIFLGRRARAFEVRRLALNMDQIEQYNPPPNPAKQTDSRFKTYVDTHGGESWELDALEPSILDAMLRQHIEAVIDPDAWEQREFEIEEVRKKLEDVVEGFES